MVPGISLKVPPRPPARRLLPLPLLLLAAMAGKSRADMGCYDYYGYWFLSDPSKCWATEINAAFNGKMDYCDSGDDNAVYASYYPDCQTTADNINKDPRYTGPAIGCLTWDNNADCEDGAKKLQLISSQYLPCWDPHYTGPDPCTSTTKTTTTTTATTATATTTTKTKTTTTTLTCNGNIDPAQCLTEYAGKCTDIVIGELVKEKCPVMCNTCTATTPTISPAAANHMLPVYAYGAIGGGALLLILGICYCLRKQRLNRLQSRHRYDAAADDDVELLNIEGTNS